MGGLEMAAVLKRSRGARKIDFLVLLVLASWSDENGEAYPSIATIARRARVTTRTVKSSLRRLVAAGEISVNHRAYDTPSAKDRRHPRRGGFQPTNLYVIRAVKPLVEVVKDLHHHQGREDSARKVVKKTRAEASRSISLESVSTESVSTPRIAAFSIDNKKPADWLPKVRDAAYRVLADDPSLAGLSLEEAVAERCRDLRYPFDETTLPIAIEDTLSRFAMRRQNQRRRA
jgi:DNA-binding Lrp family transcriptional regulator